MAIVYDVFTGDHAGGPIDYSTALGTTTGLSFTAPALPLASRTRFGVRARDDGTGLAERNTDAAVLISVDGGGRDATAQPAPPAALRARAAPNGTALVDWAYVATPGAPLPLGFHVYVGAPGAPAPDYSTPAASVPYAGRGAGPPAFRATLAGLADEVTYVVGVRAYNNAGEETNVTAVRVTGEVAPPANVAALAAVLV